MLTVRTQETLLPRSLGDKDSLGPMTPRASGVNTPGAGDDRVNHDPTIPPSPRASIRPQAKNDSRLRQPKDVARIFFRASVSAGRR
jgi:hypothetical protein